MKETLFLTRHPISGLWLLKDSRNNCIGTMTDRTQAESYAKEMNYRLQINIGGKIEWFN